MHGEIVDAIDIHLAEVHRLRRRLTDARTIEPGERLDVALEIARNTERLVDLIYTSHSRSPRSSRRHVSRLSGGA
ncbi:hypothetical protein Acy02nite_87660 [Actinoplanes cyaneus]|uniref:Uncharacterized protein n=1 Tax=Actinoplanes cyaneus TaxID=52696 RepID=A0A919IZC3_9ACTN|nr:hypothetical protein [Actinoplanes cyaneus]GID70885.1 hypothetical protein Acy02nite_87660 [Actinoplanes cyaneus]